MQPIGLPAWVPRRAPIRSGTRIARSSKHLTHQPQSPEPVGAGFRIGPRISSGTSRAVTVLKRSSRKGTRILAPFGYQGTLPSRIGNQRPKSCPDFGSKPIQLTTRPANVGIMIPKRRFESKKRVTNGIKRGGSRRTRPGPTSRYRRVRLAQPRQFYFSVYP